MIPIRIYNDVNRFTIDWTLNSKCTYHCSYCPPMLHMGNNYIKSKEQDPTIVRNFINRLDKQIQGRSVHMFINGGEPTISPVFEQLIDHVHELGWCAYVNTNGSRSLDWWQQYAHKIFKITISYHPETVVDEELIEKINYIRTKTNVGVFVLMYPPLWDKSVAAYQKFKDMGITLGISRVFKRDQMQVAESYSYSEQQLAWLDSNSRVYFDHDNSFQPVNGNYYGNTYVDYLDNNNTVTENLDEVEFTNLRKNKFLEWHCHMGKDHIFINPLGEIDQATCSSSRQIGTIENFESLTKEPTVCSSTYCMCTLDVQIPKYKK